MTETADNLVLPFQLEKSSLRGRMVHLGDALDQILRQHAYPQPVVQLLAEAIVIASALAATLKYDGVFTLQAKGDGAVRMLVADVTNEGGIRGYAQFDKDRLGDTLDTPSLLGQGYLAFTCTLEGTTERYQGIVGLDGGSLAEAVQHYFRQSEQLPTGIVAGVQRDTMGRWRGGCLLVQRMPRQGGNQESAVPEFNVEGDSVEAEDWTRAMMIMNTCTVEELADAALPAETLLYRLFHEEGVRVYDAQALRHQCRCSQSRVEGMLRSLPREELPGLTVDGKLAVTCEFCNQSYVFDEKDLKKLVETPEA